MDNLFNTRNFVSPQIMQAIELLQSRGHEVGLTGDIPGLFQIDGREVTTNQLLDIASKESLR